jgi:hypothetical protein
MALPDCYCVSGQPLGDQLSAIYCAAYTWTEDASLPTCACVDGYTLSDKLFAIYQAVFVAAEDDTLLSPYCVRGHPLGEQLTQIYTAIFCAALAVEIECTIPTLVSATIVDEILTFVFSEDVTGQDGFNGTVDGVPAAFTYLSGEGTDTYTFQSDTPAMEGDAVLLSYDISGNIVNGDCPLAAFADFPVTNNTPGIFFRTTSNGDSRVTSGADNRVLT